MLGGSPDMRPKKKLLKLKSTLRILAICGGLLLDWRYQELPEKIHPLVAFGRLMGRSEKKFYRNSKLSGLIYLWTGVAAAFCSAKCLQKIPSLLPKSKSWQNNIALAWDCLTSCLGVYFAVGGKTLWHIAEEAASFLETGDMESAKSELSKLVGRDTLHLDAPEIARAIIESVAENTVDAVTSPIFYAFTGGLVSVLVHRAVNTMDAMAGYKNERYSQFGFFSAKSDDVLNYLPARLSAVSVVCVMPGQAHKIYTTVKNEAAAHPSPNGGVIEAAFAAALDVKLGGVNFYNSIPESRPVFGSGRLPEFADINAAVTLSKKITFMSIALLVLSAISFHRCTRNIFMMGFRG